jgi:hypothetical protein
MKMEIPLTNSAGYVFCSSVNSNYHCNKYNSNSVTRMCVILHVKVGIIHQWRILKKNHLYKRDLSVHCVKTLSEMVTSAT